MSETKVTTNHVIRINGTWRTVELTINPLQLAASLGPKAAANKSQRAMVRFGAVKAKVLPL
jgi:hypothetical protein